MMLPYAHTILSQIIWLHVRQSHWTIFSFQENTYTEHFNSVHNYNMTANLSDDEVGEKIPVLFTDKYGTHLKK